MIGSIGNSYDNITYPKINYGNASVNAAFSVSTDLSEKLSPGEEKILKRLGQIECKTCANRTYVDGSNEGNVSFKTPGHISPEASYAAVSSHESEHVANAKSEDAKPGSKLVSASVSLQTATCPECGVSYVSGGTTRVQMKYANEDNPYQKDKKAWDAILFKGANINLVA